VNEVSDNMQIRIVDVMGKTIQSSSLSKNISKVEVETLSNGIYNVIIESSGSILHSTKIVINK
jgi:serine phosphatase RsbU (regulator of sigma subunit)